MVRVTPTSRRSPCRLPRHGFETYAARTQGAEAVSTGTQRTMGVSAGTPPLSSLALLWRFCRVAGSGSLRSSCEENGLKPSRHQVHCLHMKKRHGKNPVPPALQLTTVRRHYCFC